MLTRKELIDLRKIILPGTGGEVLTSDGKAKVVSRIARLLAGMTTFGVKGHTVTIVLGGGPGANNSRCQRVTSGRMERDCIIFWYDDFSPKLKATPETVRLVCHHRGLPEQELAVKFSGSLIKRIGKAFHQIGANLTDNCIDDVIAIIDDNKVADTAMALRFSEKMDWTPGVFNDYGSCFWGCRSHARWAADNQCVIVQAFGLSEYNQLVEANAIPTDPRDLYTVLRPIGRAILSPTTKKGRKAWCVHNAYGRLSHREYASLIATNLGFKTIGAYPQWEGSQDDTFYINSGTGTLLLDDDVEIDDSEDGDSCDLQIRSLHLIGECYRCGGDSCYTSDDNALGVSCCSECQPDEECARCGESWEVEDALKLGANGAATETSCCAACRGDCFEWCTRCKCYTTKIYPKNTAGDGFHCATSICEVCGEDRHVSPAVWIEQFAGERV